MSDATNLKSCPAELRARPTRPLLRYHGGKWMLAPWILQHLPPHRIYVEPFGGGGSVLLRKPRAYAEVYNDLDGEVYNLFLVARDRGEELARALELTPFARREFVVSYQPSADPLEWARRTVVRSFMGFGSAAASGQRTGFRANSRRSATSAAHDWMHFPAALREVVQRLRGVVIEQRDALEVMRQHDGIDVLHYVDPPYVHSTRSSLRTPSYRHEMSDAQHQSLLQALTGLRGMVVLSGYRCALYDSALASWHRIDVVALADRARRRSESLWLNPAAQRQLKGMQLSLTLEAPAATVRLSEEAGPPAPLKRGFDLVPEA